MEVLEVPVGHQKVGAPRDWRDTTIWAISIYSIEEMWEVGVWCFVLLGMVRWSWDSSDSCGDEGMVEC